MSNITISDKDVTHALRNLRKPSRLAKSKLASSCLVKRHSQSRDLIPKEAIQEVLLDVLSVLEEDNADYADLLRGRFWEGHTVTKMRMSERPQAIAERTFFNYQKEAIEQFVSIFKQKEEACLRRQQALEAESADEPTTAPPKPTEPESEPPTTEPLLDDEESSDDDESSSLDTPLAPASDAATDQPPSAPDMEAPALSEPKVSIEQTSNEDSKRTALVTVEPTLSLNGYSASALPQRHDDIDSLQKRPTLSRSTGAIMVLVLLVGFMALWIANPFVTPSPETAQKATEAAIEPTFVATSLPTQNVVRLTPTEVATEPTFIATSSATQNVKEVTPTVSVTASPTAQSRAAICGEESRLDDRPAPRFEHRQGVSAFRVDNTPHAILNNKVRSVAIGSTGLWIGYYADDLDPSRNGLTHFDKQTWGDCNHPGGPKGKNINAIAVDSKGQVWVGAEGRVSGGGVSRFDGQSWYTYSTADGLPSNDTFGLTIDDQDHVWVATWEGLAKFDGKKWTTPYRKSNGTLFDDHIHAMAVDSANNIWVGHINNGLSLLEAGASQWVHHTTESELSGNEIRSIVVRPATENSPESVWLATGDGGITKYEPGTWTIYNEENGLPSNQVHALAIDKYNRVWAATAKGVVYLSDSKWVTYNTLNTLSIAFGLACEDCPFDDEDVWTGTAEVGATHSRLPYPDAAIDVLKACFERTGQEPTCHAPTEESNDEVAIITYPEALTPGEEVRLEIRAAPRSPYELREDRGDLLINLAATEERYGTWLHMLTKDVVHSGQPFAYTDHENSLKVPDLANGETFSSSWRVWMHTRYTGPEIRLLFTVRESNQK